jgi:acetate kinase
MKNIIHATTSNHESPAGHVRKFSLNTLILLYCMSRSVLIMNMGSSSLKWAVLDADTESVEQEGDAHWDATSDGRHADELAAALGQVKEVSAVGHRVVHGGTTFRDAVVVDDRVREGIAQLVQLAPLHNPSALAGIDAAVKQFPRIPQVAAFDTAFHRDIPDPAAMYAVPWDWTQRWGLRRFGFHGLSVAYAVSRATELLGRLPARLVVCHLGAGCSVTAVATGRSVHTSMGFTPLEGVMMTQRSGSVDPGLLLDLLTRQGVEPADADRALNQQSGLLGVSGVSSDLRDVLKAAEAGNSRAGLAVDMFVHRLVETVGGMVATLNGLDAVVFTGGIGEHSGLIRTRACASFGYLGLSIDATRNDADPVDLDVATDASAVRVLIITAREDLTILRQVKSVLNWN